MVGIGLERGVQLGELGVVDAVLPADLARRAEGDDAPSEAPSRKAATEATTAWPAPWPVAAAANGPWRKLSGAGAGGSASIPE
jgi:hypothetical protein